MLFVALLMAAQAPAVSIVSTAPTDKAAIEAKEINEDSARDLKDSRFYNRPGATRADYDADWQECRLIARGSQTMGGQTVVVPYNPGIISPMAAAGGDERVGQNPRATAGGGQDDRLRQGLRPVRRERPVDALGQIAHERPVRRNVEPARAGMGE